MRKDLPTGIALLGYERNVEHDRPPTSEGEEDDGESRRPDSVDNTTGGVYGGVLQ